MKKTLVFILLISPVYIHGQGKVLDDCHLIPQQRSRWCWAASIEMLYDYLKKPNTIAQCEIAKLNPGLNPNQDKQKFCDSLCVAVEQDHGNATLKAENGYQKIFEILLGTNPYKKHNKILTWGDTKILIDNKSPFLLSGLSYKDLYANTLGHVVVSNGYWATTGTITIKWLHILDPYNPYGTLCQGCEYWIPYCNLLKKRGNDSIFCSSFASSLNVIYNKSSIITTSQKQRDKVEDCQNFAKKTKEELLGSVIAHLNENKNLTHLFPNIAQEPLQAKDFNEYMVYDISAKQLKNYHKEYHAEFMLNKLFVANEERSIFVSNTNPRLQITVVKYANNCNLYFLEAIGDKCFIENLGTNSSSKVQFEIIRTPPYSYAFIKKTTLTLFNHNLSSEKDITYIPLNNYPELELEKEELNENEFIKLLILKIYKNEYKNFE